MPVNEYLRIAKKLLTENAWRLSTFIIDRGYVYIDNRNKVLRLLTEYIYNTITSKLKNLKLSCEIDENFKSRFLAILQEFDSNLATSINDFLQKHSRHETVLAKPATLTQVKIVENLVKVGNVEELLGMAKVMFPPCIRSLVEALTKGENLSHHQRFAIATFLINIGVDLEVILKLFSFSPDFNEKLARYQIEHLAGLRGSKRKYLVYSCNTMKTLGICKAECGIKNPLMYLRKTAKEHK